MKSRSRFAIAIVAFAAAGGVSLSSATVAQEVIQATGTGAGLPYDAYDQATNTHTGIVVDLLNAIAADAGFTIEYLAALPVADLIPAVAAGTVTLTSSNVGITAARQELIDFSVPYHNAAEALVVLASDETPYTSLQDFAGAIVGTVGGSLYDRGLNAIAGVFGGVRLYATVGDVAQAVLAGEIKAGILSSVPIEYALANGDYVGLRVVPTYQTQFNSQLGIGITKGRQELLNAINASLTRMINDGTVGQIFADYGIAWLQP